MEKRIAARKLHAALGGTPAMMARLGVSRRRVNECVAAGAFPPAWFDEIEQMLGAPAPRELFAWTRAGNKGEN